MLKLVGFAELESIRVSSSWPSWAVKATALADARVAGVLWGHEWK